MYGFPEHLLNRTNAALLAQSKELRARVASVRGEAAETRRGADEAAVLAKEAARTLQMVRRQLDEHQAAASKADNTTAALDVDIRTRQSTLSNHTKIIHENEQRIALVKSEIERQRSRLETAEGSTAALQQSALQWLAENQATDAAVSSANAVMQALQRQITSAFAEINRRQTATKQLMAELELEAIAADESLAEAETCRERTRATREALIAVQAQLSNATSDASILDEQIREQTAAKKALEGQLELAIRTVAECKSTAEVAARNKEALQRQVDGRMAEKHRKLANSRQILAEIDDTTLQTTFLNRQRISRETEIAASAAAQEVLLQDFAELDRQQHELQDVAAQFQAALGAEEAIVVSAETADRTAQALLATLAQHLGRVEATLGRVMNRIGIANQQNATAAQVVVETNDTLLHLQKLRAARVDIESKLKVQLQANEERLAVVDDAIEQIRTSVAVLKDDAGGKDDVRAQLKERIVALRRELDACHVGHVRLKSSVATVTLRVEHEHAASSRLLQTQAAELETQRRAEAEAQALKGLLHRTGGEASGLKSTVQGLRDTERLLMARLTDTQRGAEEAAVAVQSVARAVEVQSFEVQAKIDDLAQCAIQEEQERRRLAARAQDLKAQLTILQSRHASLQDVLTAAMLRETEGRHAFDPNAAPETLQAVIMANRGYQRQELQASGDKLDSAICKLERELVALDRLITVARATRPEEPAQLVPRSTSLELIDDTTPMLEAEIKSAIRAIEARDEQLAAANDGFQVAVDLLAVATAERNARAVATRQAAAERHTALVQANLARRVQARPSSATPATAMPARPKAAALVRAFSSQRRT